MTKQKGNMVLIIIVIVLAVCLLSAIVVGAYFWWKSKSVTQTKTTISPTASQTATPTPTPTKTQESQPAESPKQVVNNFINYTLGMSTTADINYDKARSLMTESFQAAHSGEGWVPLMYGIQDGPSSVEIVSENINGENASVKVNAFWGDMGLGWAFSLVKENNQWLIDGFRNTAQ